ncbi:DUF5681 domain-containing protein [Mesorhizobium koreense]|uniref:DUF5681 domain-containing protein n=1 Tax=Mesorhizobium koreense TaxID=3074855 RepID=UPI00287B7001|nr:DUF5681 domain-containing protein [Mesorhizobium sp. WR6]
MSRKKDDEGLEPGGDGLGRDDMAADGSYQVGYGHPPLATRFQKGNQAARKKGRPKGRRSNAVILKEILDFKVDATFPDGTRRKISLWEAAARKIALKAVQGDLKAWTELNRLSAVYGINLLVPPLPEEPVSDEEANETQRFFGDWVVLNPALALMMLKATPCPPITSKIEGRPTARRIDFRLAGWPGEEAR